MSFGLPLGHSSVQLRDVVFRNREDVAEGWAKPGKAAFQGSRTFSRGRDWRALAPRADMWHLRSFLYPPYSKEKIHAWS